MQVLGAAGIGTWDLDLRTGRATVSDAQRALYGVPPGGRLDVAEWLACIHPDDRPQLMAEREAALAEGRPYAAEFRIRRAGDGAVRWVRAYGSHLLAPDGSPEALAGITIDVTAQRAAEGALAASERRYRAIAETGAVALWAADATGEVTEGQGWEHWTGQPPDSQHGAGWLAMVHPDDRDQVATAWRQVLASGLPGEAECRICIHGEWRWVRGRGVPVRDADGTLLEWAGILRDIHDQRVAQLALADSESFLRSVLEASTDCVKVLDAEGRLVFMNANGLRLREIGDFDLVRGKSWPSLWPGESHAALHAAVAAALAGGATRFEGFCPTARGTPKWWDVAVAPIPGPEGRIERLVAISRDITERRAAEDELRREMARRSEAEAEARRLALHDPLTGLPNRRLLAEQGPALLARAQAAGLSAAVLVLDLDRFKPLNDLYGHAAGDAALREVAARLREALRAEDMVARTGGDEFAVVASLGAADAAEAAASLARRIVAAAAAPVSLEGGEVATVGVSVGIALAAPQGQAELAALVRRADAALFRAKAEGRGTFRFHEPAIDALRLRRARTETELRRALPEDRIVPYYQPLVDLASGRIEGFEVLARWQHPERGLVLPEDFIPVAEDAGLIGALTGRVLRRAAADAASWPSPLPIAVNLSPLLLRDPGIAGRLLHLLAESGLPPGRLEVEVTESAMIAGQDSARAIAATLKAAGVRLAMDDFGTGYSSLASLRALPFDRIKIHRSFVATLGADAESEKIVAAIVALGSGLGLPCVAEGVEDAETARRVAALGCRTGQGWHFGRPVPAAAIPPLLGGPGAAAAA